MKFNSLALVGLLLVALGIAGLVHPNVVMPGHKQELQIAGSKVIMETRRVITIPGVLGVLIIVAGAAAVLLSQVDPTKTARGSARRR
ncbi:MAG: hypothetical protein ACRD59_02300 [Candidatus Acidiferrales bacterium]